MTRPTYQATRDRWMAEHDVPREDPVPSHQCDIATPRSGDEVGEHDPTDTIHFEELHPSGEPCGGLVPGLGLMTFGSPTSVLASLSRLRPDHEWVVRTAAALTRERLWSHDPRYGLERRRDLKVFRAAEAKFHVSSSLNRDSIAEHGLDWTRMGAAPSIMGRSSPELPVVFLEYHLEACDFFIRMARFPVDVWEVDADGLWAESGPDGWIVVPEPIPAERLRLVKPAKSDRGRLPRWFS